MSLADDILEKNRVDEAKKIGAVEIDDFVDSLYLNEIRGTLGDRSKMFKKLMKEFQASHIGLDKSTAAQIANKMVDEIERIETPPVFKKIIKNLVKHLAK
jgi:hypothetical protein